MLRWVVLLGVVVLAAGETGRAARVEAAPPNTRKVTVFLVKLDDNGKSGRRIGCGDSLVPVSRVVPANRPPLLAAISALLAVPQKLPGNPKLQNFWRGRRLKIQSVATSGRTATIRLAGDLVVSGVCDQPRIEEQIYATARRAAAIRDVDVYLNDVPLREAIR